MATPKKPRPTYIREIELRYRKRRVKADSPVHQPLTDPEKVYQLFSDMQNEAKEKLITISLDSKLKMLCFEVVAVGALNSVYSRPAEALRASISLNSHGVILVHNHPSGDPTPSQSDKNFTYQLLFHTLSLGIEFHDHIIIGDNGHFSFVEKGLMKTLITEARTERQRTLKNI